MDAGGGKSEGEQNASIRCIALAPTQMLVIAHVWRFIDDAAATARLEALLAGLELS